MDKYPLLFDPILKERVWGGRALETRFGRYLPRGKRIGESWDLVDRPSESSVVRNGPLAGRALRDLCVEFGRELLGRNAPQADRFPLIVKLLDANQPLSVQVHPTARYVAQHPEADAPKSEAWYVVDAPPEAAADRHDAVSPQAAIIYGLKPGVTVADLAAALTSGEIEPILQTVGVEPGHFYYLPAGLIHALLPGSLIVEIQQNSDTTFRLHDWGRVGLDGKPRTLHVAEGLEAAAGLLADPTIGRFVELGKGPVVPRVERTTGLICPSFQIEKLVLDGGEVALPLDPASFTVLIVVEGTVSVSCQEGAAVETMVREGETTLVPAGLSVARCRSEAGAGLIRTILPRLQ
ncbi:MAG: class I mannose-6-phosphate isomerase [Verrucomicrobia bacterium]|nr:class I mannose-6-phosphate isomerase [Verrucomicrobiota bacterium]